jgi:hypothetical protein
MDLAEKLKQDDEKADELIKSLSDKALENVDDEDTNTNDTNDSQDIIDKLANDQNAANTNDDLDGAQKDAQVDPASTSKDTYKDRYMVLKGKYDAETRKMMDDLSERDKVIQFLTNRVDALEASLKPEPKEDKEPSKIELGDYEDETVKKLVDHVNKQNDVINSLNEKLDQLQSGMNTVKETSQQNTMETFRNQLLAAVPEAAELNNDPLFTQWLKDKTKGGLAYFDLIRMAFQRYDVNGVAGFFQEYLKEGESASSQNTETTQSKNIMPGKSHNTQVRTAQPVVKEITTDDINKATRMVQEGKLAEEDFDKLYTKYVKQVYTKK